MKILISYFYQIRNMSPNMIPLSTACGDPAWFHNFKEDKNYQFKDKRGVWNGARAEIFSPSEVYCADGGCCKGCSKNPETCDFLKNYLEYLRSLDFYTEWDHFKGICEQALLVGITNPIPVLIVHEAPTNKCSERGPLIQWFKENGYELKEFNKDEIYN